jgi:hypothetical protein
MSFINATELAIIDEVFGATAFGADATLYAAAFTTVPADDGTGGVEANYTSYARVSKTNNGTNFASANPKQNSTTVDFPQATGAQTGTLKAIGWYTASSGGTLRAIARLMDNVIRSAVGLNTGDIIHAPGHTFANDSKVVFYAPAGVTLPTGLSADTEYYVINAVASQNFQVSTTQGGAAVTITADGGCVVGRSRHTVVNIGDTPQIAVGGWTMELD